jgi:hypothetical protein
MPFQINGSSPSGDAVPHGRGYKFILPESSGMSGEGLAVGAIGYPSVRLQFERLSAAGWAWYTAFTGSNPSVALTSLQVFDPYLSTPGWEIYDDAVMHRPTYEDISQGSYLGVEVLFTKLETPSLP